MIDGLSEPVQEAVRSVVDGWYPEGRIDWGDFLDRVEEVSGEDLGNDLLSERIRQVKAYARNYRKL